MGHIIEKGPCQPLTHMSLICLGHRTVKLDIDTCDSQFSALFFYSGPLWKDPYQQRPPLNKEYIFLTPKPSITHKPPPLRRPPLYKDQFHWKSAAVFIE